MPPGRGTHIPRREAPAASPDPGARPAQHSTPRPDSSSDTPSYPRTTKTSPPRRTPWLLLGVVREDVHRPGPGWRRPGPAGTRQIPWVGSSRNRAVRRELKRVPRPIRGRHALDNGTRSTRTDSVRVRAPLLTEFSDDRPKIVHPGRSRGAESVEKSVAGSEGHRNLCHVAMLSVTLRRPSECVTRGTLFGPGMVGVSRPRVAGAVPASGGTRRSRAARGRGSVRRSARACCPWPSR